MEICAQDLRKYYLWVLFLMIALIGVVSVLPLSAAPAETPSYWDPRRRPEKPDLRGVETLRFLTEDEFPPFNFTGANGALEGFNVDIARAICAELGVTCTIQARRFDTIVDALAAEEGDAIIAALAATPAARQKMRFSDPYFRSPARFVAMKAQAEMVITPKALDGKRVAVVSGTAHEAYLAAFFPATRRVTAKTATLARDLLTKGEADVVFGDGVSLAFWLNGDASKACCQFVGGAYAESHFFGEGLTIAVRPDDITLEKAMNYALFRLWERGVHADLVARWFPVNPYAASR
jgi:polar amino acid transport system substrate-binding protein